MGFRISGFTCTRLLEHVAKGHEVIVTHIASEVALRETVEALPTLVGLAIRGHGSRTSLKLAPGFFLEKLDKMSRKVTAVLSAVGSKLAEDAEVEVDACAAAGIEKIDFGARVSRQGTDEIGLVQ